jgi:hypothetical protein
MATAQRLAVLPFSKYRYRVRIPGDLAATLGWPKTDSGTQCFGIFRGHGELLCTAQELESAERIQTLQGMTDSNESQHIQTQATTEVPSAEELVLPFRVIHFRAVWLKAPSTQLELQLSVTNTERLGWTIGSRTPIYAVSWSRFLLLMSETRYAETHDEPIEF